MTVILIKLLKDFWAAKIKLILCLVAAGLSAWGISTVIYTYLMAERDFQVNFAQTFPADFEILIDDYSPKLDVLLLADEKVIDIERREIIGGRIKTVAGEWMPVLLFAAADFENMRMDVFQTLEQISVGTDHLFVETNARSFLDPEKDSVSIRFSNDQEVTWPISGTTHDARLAPARMERAVYVHLSSIKMIERYLRPGRRRMLVKTNADRDKKSIQDVADRVSELVKEGGGTVVYVSIPSPGKHMHQNIVDGISYIQESAGLTISLMGIILLSLMLLTWIFPQLPDVGVMKALGCSTQRIFYSYCLVLSMVIFFGLLVGMPLGYRTAAAFNGVIAGIQNFMPVRETLFLPAHIAVALMCICIPLVPSLLSLRKASRTTVHQAIHKTFFTRAGRAVSNLQLWISDSYILYGVNNLLRNTTRTLLLIVLTTIGVALYFTGSNLEHSIRSEMDHFAEEARYALNMQFSEGMKLEDIHFLSDLDFVDQISPLKDVMISFQPPGLPYRENKRLRILSSAHEIAKEFVLAGQVDKTCGECLYISGEGMKNAFREVELGTIVELTFPSGEDKAYRYSGILKDMAAIGAAFFVFDDVETYTFNALAFRIDPDTPTHEATNSIDDALLANGIDVAGILNVDLRLASLSGHLEPFFLIAKVLGAITIFIGLISLIIVLNLTIMERTREIGILKSLGASLPKISAIFHREFLFVNSISILLGVLISMPFSAALCRVFGQTIINHEIPLSFNAPYILVASLVILLIQWMLIATHNYFKLRKNARELLVHNF